MNLGVIFITEPDMLCFDRILAHFTALYGNSRYVIGRKPIGKSILWRCYFRFVDTIIPQHVVINGVMSSDVTLDPYPEYHNQCYIGQYRSTLWSPFRILQDVSVAAMTHF